MKTIPSKPEITRYLETSVKDSTRRRVKRAGSKWVHFDRYISARYLKRTKQIEFRLAPVKL